MCVCVCVCLFASVNLIIPLFSQTPIIMTIIFNTILSILIILFSFQLPVCNARYIYIYIICVSTRKHNDEFILEFILRENKDGRFRTPTIRNSVRILALKLR